MVWTIYDLTWINRYQDRLNVNCPVDYVIYKATGTSSWYRIWKSGWVEQGGTINGSTSSSGVQINFPVKFASTVYTALLTPRVSSTGTLVASGKILESDIAVGSMKVQFTYISNGGSAGYAISILNWYACGNGDATEIEMFIDGIYGYRY